MEIMLEYEVYKHGAEKEKHFEMRQCSDKYIESYVKNKDIFAVDIYHASEVSVATMRGIDIYNIYKCTCKSNNILYIDEAYNIKNADLTRYYVMLEFETKTPRKDIQEKVDKYNKCLSYFDYVDHMCDVYFIFLELPQWIDEIDTGSYGRYIHFIEHNEDCRL